MFFYHSIHWWGEKAHHQRGGGFPKGLLIGADFPKRLIYSETIDPLTLDPYIIISQITFIIKNNEQISIMFLALDENANINLSYVL